MKPKGVRRPTEDAALGRLKNWVPNPIDLEAIKQRNPLLAAKIERYQKELNERSQL